MSCKHVFVSLGTPFTFEEQFGEWGSHWRVYRCVNCGLIDATDGTVSLHERRIIKFDNYEYEPCPENEEDFYM